MIIYTKLGFIAYTSNRMLFVMVLNVSRYGASPTWYFIYLLFEYNAGEIVSHEKQEYCANNGIHLVPVPAYRHTFIGVAERYFSTLFCKTEQ